VQRYNSPMQPFCVARIILQEIIKKGCWQLKYPNDFQLVNVRTWQRFAIIILCRTWIVNSAKEKHELATTKQNWLQIGYNFEMYKKEKSRKSLTYRILSKALQDGIGFKKMKSLETFRRYKKLKYRQLRVSYEKFSKVKISPNLKNWVQIGCSFQKKCVSLHPVKRIWYGTVFSKNKKRNGGVSPLHQDKT